MKWPANIPWGVTIIFARYSWERCTPLICSQLSMEYILITRLFHKHLFFSEFMYNSCEFCCIKLVLIARKVHVNDIGISNPIRTNMLGLWWNVCDFANKFHMKFILNNFEIMIIYIYKLFTYKPDHSVTRVLFQFAYIIDAILSNSHPLYYNSCLITTHMTNDCSGFNSLDRSWHEMLDFFCFKILWIGRLCRHCRTQCKVSERLKLTLMFSKRQSPKIWTRLIEYGFP